MGIQLMQVIDVHFHFFPFRQAYHHDLILFAQIIQPPEQCRDQRLIIREHQYNVGFARNHTLYQPGIVALAVYNFLNPGGVRD
ncbi:hypothetical protein DSECCO2_516750 [anaerobic digester metagenome]